MRGFAKCAGVSALALGLLLSLAPLAVAQEEIPEADPADVASIDAIIAALYDVISGPPGARDWDRFRSLFARGATLAPTVPLPDGTAPIRVISPQGFANQAGEYLESNPFFEVEAGRKLNRFGNMANAMSLYESRTAPEEEPFARGINSITMLTDGERWYIQSVAWDEVRDDNPLPEGYE